MNWSFITNGTVYNEEFFKQLARLDKLASQNKESSFFISSDNFHVNAASKIITYVQYKQIIKKLSKSRFIDKEIKYIDHCNDYLLNEGRAKTLKIPIKKITNTPPNIYFHESEQSVRAGLVLAVNHEGDVVPVNTSYKRQKKEKYGNIFKTSLKEIIYNSGKACKTDKEYNETLEAEKESFSYHA